MIYCYYNFSYSFIPEIWKQSSRIGTIRFVIVLISDVVSFFIPQRKCCIIIHLGNQMNCLYFSILYGISSHSVCVSLFSHYFSVFWYYLTICVAVNMCKMTSEFTFCFIFYQLHWIWMANPLYVIIKVKNVGQSNLWLKAKTTLTWFWINRFIY